MITRRGLLRGLGTLLAAPAIVKASSLMAISPIPVWHEWEVYLGEDGFYAIGAMEDLADVIYPEFSPSQRKHKP